MFHLKANDDHRGNTTKSRARKNSKGQAAMPETAVTNAFKVPGDQGLWRWLMGKVPAAYTKRTEFRTPTATKKDMVMSAVTSASGR